MTDILDYPDNVILHLERDRRSLKCFTTDEKNKFKVINGLYEMDSVIDTKYYTVRDLKQLLVDSIINGYVLKLNLIFKQGVHNVVKELAAEREEYVKQQELLTKDEIAAEVVSDSDDEKVRVIYEEHGEDKVYEVVAEEEIPEKYF
jgi:hypothetical protein